MIPKIYKARLKKLRQEFKRSKISALLITKSVNIQYLTGFRGEDSWALVTSSKVYLISDFRYQEEIKKEFPWVILELRGKAGKTIFDAVRHLARKNNVKCFGFESRNISYASFQSLKTACKKTRLVPTKGLVESVRMVKDPTEIKALKKAARITDKTLSKMLKKARRGLKELDLKYYAESQIRELGGEGPAFDIIVASGPKSSCPHANTGRNTLKNGTGLLIDMGSRVNSYHSDLTRTFFAGSISAQFRKIYAAVLEAQEMALSVIRPGIEIGEIDRAARRALERRGLAKYFGHSTGHGVGLEIHEAPLVFSSNRGLLKENMVFTVEPGVYIPGWGGIRIEDCVRVTKTGSELITHYPKNKLKVDLGL